MSKSINVYLVNCDTEYFSSETRILGVYLTEREARERVEKEAGVGEMLQGSFGTYWRDESAGLRYYLRSFPLGDQKKEILTHRGKVVTISYKNSHNNVGDSQ